jgi:hypothetical protein
VEEETLGNRRDGLASDCVSCYEVGMKGYGDYQLDVAHGVGSSCEMTLAELVDGKQAAKLEFSRQNHREYCVFGLAT